jgi:ribosome maturation factor RimP
VSERGTCAQPNRKTLSESSEKTAKLRSSAVVGDVEAVVRPLLEEHGLELFELSFRLEQGGWVLRVIIDTPEASDPTRHVSVDQCADVSRDLSAALDEADPLPQAYRLEVSSPGVERPLRGRSDYARFVGQPAKITLLKPMEGASAVIRGKLAGVEDDCVLVDVDQPQVLSIPLPSIKRANLVYEMPGQPKKGTSKKKRRSSTERRD